MEFSARLPSTYKLKGPQLRWFFKEALRDFLPPEIIAKQKHGFGLPVGEWIAGHRAAEKDRRRQPFARCIVTISSDQPSSTNCWSGAWQNIPSTSATWSGY